jgi:hypothetical protein
MRLDELRTRLEDLAGSATEATARSLAEVHRAARRQRRTRGAIVVMAGVVVLVIIGGLVWGGSDTPPRVVVPAATTPPPPPTVDPRDIWDQPRIGVADRNGPRGTIPTSAYLEAMGIMPDGSVRPGPPSNTPVPVIDDAGRITGYWIPSYGFVERSVVEDPGFDPDAFAAEHNANADAEWWKALTAEQLEAIKAKKMPSVIGLPREDAAAILARIGCSVRASFQDVPPAQEGTVLSQSPPAGELIFHCRNGTFVDIIVGS